MISIQKNQTIPEHPDLRVLYSSGDYGDNDLIECSTIDNPDFALCAFSSSYIKYGNIVNQFSDPLELGKKLIEIDPDCTHDTAILFKEEEARRIKREGGDFTPENPVPTDETVKEAEKVPEDKENDPAITENTPSDTEPVSEQDTVSEDNTSSSPSSSESSPNESEPAPETPVNTETSPSEPEPQPQQETTPEAPVAPTPSPETSTPEPQSQETTPEAPTPVEVLIDAVKTTLE